MTIQDILHHYPDSGWSRAVADTSPTHGVERVVESGGVLCFPRLPFEFTPAERALLERDVASGKAKNISLRTNDELRGAVDDAEVQRVLKAMVLRFRTQAVDLASRLFPHYVGRMQVGNASFRPVPVEDRSTSWRADDTRLHVDAFPSNPVRGRRLLRVFTNVNMHGKPRQWLVGEPFEDFARRFAPRVRPALPGSSWLLHKLGVTKAPRTAYDHVMLHLHDLGKADLDYQRTAPRQAVDFAPGTTWVVFSDQVLHAVVGGQYMMEQTIYLDPDDQVLPEASPLRVLERQLGRALR